MGIKLLYHPLSWVINKRFNTLWAPKNWCFWTVVLEKTLESPLDSKEMQPVHSEGDQPWDFFGRNDAKAETPVLWPPHVKSWLIGKDWCWEGLGAGGEGDDRGWDDWMASLTHWTWVWVNSGSWWWTGRPGMLWFMGSQRVRDDRVTELNWTEKKKVRTLCLLSFLTSLSALCPLTSISHSFSFSLPPFFLCFFLSSFLHFSFWNTIESLLLLKTMVSSW